MNPGMNKPVTFTFGDAERIGHAVKKSERERRGRKPSTLPRAAGSGGGGGGVVLAGQYLGAWPKGQSKSVTITDIGVTFTAATTVSVMNRLADIMPAEMLGATRVCYVFLSEVNAASWSLVNAET
jgi:hypothetical protein